MGGHDVAMAIVESRIVDTNPVVEDLGRRLRLAVIGGGPGSFIGEMHRAAARLDDRYRIVAAALSSDPGRARAAARRIGVPAERAYGSGTELIDREAARDDGADVVAIMTPNDTHREYCLAALERGFDVICDKPLANSLDDALAVVRAVRETEKVFALTHNYTGYPMVRQARAMVAAGQLGEIRLVQVEYVQGGNAAADAGSDGVRWRFDPARSGPSLILGDIGTHAHHLVCYVAGVELQAVAADVGAIVPGRQIHDYAGVLLRFAGGARGCLWATQAAAGVESSLGFRISGALGTVEWHQDRANELRFLPLAGPAQVRTRNGPGTLPLSARGSRVGKGHPEGFHEGFANIYADAAEAIAARRSGRTPDPLALHFPTAEDGARGLRFVEAALASSAAGGGWVDCRLTLD